MMHQRSNILESQVLNNVTGEDRKSAVQSIVNILRQPNNEAKLRDARKAIHEAMDDEYRSMEVSQKEFTLLTMVELACFECGAFETFVGEVQL